MINFLDGNRQKCSKGTDADNTKITFSMNTKGGMYLVYKEYSFAKKSASTTRNYWRCIHQKAYGCQASIAQVLSNNKFKVLHEEHNHHIITERRKPGEFRALLKKRCHSPKK